MGKKKITKITDLQPDPRNFNIHTPFGMGLLEKSMQQHGFMEAGVISEDGVIISGNARQETANNIGIEDVEIIDTDGKRAIYLRAKGIKSGTKEFHELALKLNATAKANIVFDAELVEAELSEAVCEEWGLDTGTKDEFGTQFTLPDGDKAPFQQMTFTLADAQAERIKQAIKEVEIKDGTQYGNENSNGNALHQIVLEWAEQKILS